jgi:methanogenic corrinoid protein MtbC1
MTGVPAPTMRSWERRYGFPTPSRTMTARRLYSDADVQAIRWVREQTERGLSVAQAIEWAIKGGAQAAPSALPSPAAPPAPPLLVERLLAAVTTYDEQGFEAVLNTAFAGHAADVVLLELLTPALVEVGERWASGNLPVAAEHFCTNLIRRRLLSLLAAQPQLSHRLSAALACLPGEQHEIGLLMLALFLRWSGVQVYYLGMDMPAQDLVVMAAGRNVDVVCLSAGSEAWLTALEDVVAGLRRAGSGARIYAGGRGLRGRATPDGVKVLNGDLREAVEVIVRDNLAPNR